MSPRVDVETTGPSHISIDGMISPDVFPYLGGPTIPIVSSGLLQQVAWFALTSQPRNTPVRGVVRAVGYVAVITSPGRRCCRLEHRDEPNARQTPCLAAHTPGRAAPFAPGATRSAGGMRK